MAYLHRLISGSLLLFVALFLAFPGPAKADFPAQLESYDTACLRWFNEGYSTVPTASYQGCVADANPAYANVSILDTNNGQVFVVSVGIQRFPSCPANTNPVGNNCRCVTGYTENGSSCQTNAAAAGAASKAVADALNMIGKSLSYVGGPSLMVCQAGQTIIGSASICAGTNCELMPPFGGGGAPCSSSDNGSGGTTEKPSATPSNCPVGRIAGEVNGLGVCLKPTTGNTVQSTKVSSTSTGGDGVTGIGGSGGGGGAGTGGATSGAGLPGGSGGGSGVSDISTKTTCGNGACTTTQVVTSTSSTGTKATVTSTASESQENFCTKNPKNALCLASVFGGSCSAGFICDGDAIQCAVAREAFTQNCRMNQANSASALFDAESVKTGNQTLDLPGNETINIGSSSFDTTNALGVGASCIQNVNISVMGRSVALPFSTVCPYLETLGNLLLAVSFLLAARIVSRG